MKLSLILPIVISARVRSPKDKPSMVEYYEQLTIELDKINRTPFQKKEVNTPYFKK